MSRLTSNSQFFSFFLSGLTSNDQFSSFFHHFLFFQSGLTLKRPVLIIFQIFLLLTWTYSPLPVKLIFIISFFHFIFSSGLTLHCQSNSFPSFFFISFFYSSGLTLYCQSNSFVFTYLDLPSNASSRALTSSLMFTWLDLHLWCQTCWDLRLFENLDLTKLSSFVRRSFWS